MPYSVIEDVINERKKTKKTFSINEKAPVLSIILDKNLNKEDLDLLESIDAGLKKLEIELILVSKENLKQLKAWDWIEYNMENRQNALKMSDMVIAFDFSDTEELKMNGCIAISHKNPHLKNYNAQSEEGDSFIFDEKDPFLLFACIVKALEAYKFSYDWKHIVRNALGYN